MAWHFRLYTSMDSAPAYGDALDPFFGALSLFAEEEDSQKWLVDGYSAARPDMEALDIALALAAASLGEAQPAYTLEKLAPRDWVAENQAQFQPLKAGRFYIYGSHIQQRPPHGLYPLLIDAGNAFGTGEHASTKGCLQALTYLKKRHVRGITRVVDVGCGSGVLAMAALKAWPEAQVDAGDIDAPSVVTARRNALANGQPQLQPVQATGMQQPLWRGKRYQLIFANILARPLCRLAPAFRAHSQPGSYVVLAGLTVRQIAMVRHAYQKQGFILKKVWRLGVWAALLLQR